MIRQLNKGLRFQKFEEKKRPPFDKLFDIFKELLTYTSGDFDEAFSWLEQLDKEYNLTQGKDLSKILYFSVNNIDEADKVMVYLRKKASLRKDKIEQDFGDLIIKGRDSKGNIVTKDSVRKVSYKSKSSIIEKTENIDDIEVKDEQQVSNDADQNQTKLKF